jgi:hypothetical protein
MTNYKQLSKVRNSIENENIEWTEVHEKVGVTVAKYFYVDNVKTLFYGEVTKYAAPSKKGRKNQLYHVVFTDNDEEDWNERQLSCGEACVWIMKWLAAQIAKRTSCGTTATILS